MKTEWRIKFENDTFPCKVEQKWSVEKESDSKIKPGLHLLSVFEGEIMENYLNKTKVFFADIVVGWTEKKRSLFTKSSRL